MNHEQTAKLVRLIGACCPAQNLDEYTADIWQPILKGIVFDDAQQALIELARTAPFISPADIITRVQKIHNERIARAGELTPPPTLTQAEEREWLRITRQYIANGIPSDIAQKYTSNQLAIPTE